MPGIDHTLVDAVWQDLAALDPERARAGADAFLERQPGIAAFAERALGEIDPAIREAGLGLAFLLLAVLERALERRCPELDEARLDGAWEDALERAAAAGGTDAVLRELDGGVPDDVAGYIVATLYGGPGQGAGYDPGARAGLYLLVSTLAEVAGAALAGD